jgi:DMSO/TMAO reductase YedYZ molybdopterin-dependent catalytic subunit
MASILIKNYQTKRKKSTSPQKHGFSLRLVYEDAYGYDWVKYVEEIIVS